MALGSLLEACATHYKAFHVPNFGGLDVVFRNDLSALDKGEAGFHAHGGTCHGARARAV